VIRKRATKAAKKRRQANPEKYKRARRVSLLKNRYGLTPECYESLIVKQAGGCAICRVTLTMAAQVHLDHCHATGKVRGILCQKCNIGLGHFNDDMKLLRSAIHYLIDPPYH
jgi:hypothetical protein